VEGGFEFAEVEAEALSVTVTYSESGASEIPFCSSLFFLPLAAALAWTVR